MGQVCETHPTPQRKHCLKQLPQKAALPDVDLAVVNVGHFPEYGGYHRRKQRLWKHRSWVGIRLVTNWTLRPIAFSCKSAPYLHGVLLR